MLSNMVYIEDPATPQLYTLPLHDALPICQPEGQAVGERRRPVFLEEHLDHVRAELEHAEGPHPVGTVAILDRKSTRLNSSHVKISYAVFCLKKKTQTTLIYRSSPTC